MKAAVMTLLLVLFAWGLACAADLGDIDEESFSPEAKALKAKYDAQIKQLQEEFMAELQKLSARVDSVERKTAPPAKKPWYDGIRISGYFQTRFEGRQYDSIATERDEFTLRRLYMTLAAPLGDRSTAIVTWAGVGPSFREGGGATYENIFVDYKVRPDVTIRMGQAPNNFGLDAAESSSVRIPPERALVTEGNPTLGLLGLYAYGPADRGLWAIYDGRVNSPTKEGLRVAVGIFNGQFQDSDKNNNKSVSVDAEYYMKWGQFGASWMDGKYTNKATPPVTCDRDAWGLNVRVYPDPWWGGQAEYIKGDWFGAEREGWYGQVSYNLHPNKDLVYARYEEFDANTNVPNSVYKGLHVGYQYKLTPNDQITVEYVKGELGRGAADAGDDTTDDIFVQYQRSF